MNVETVIVVLIALNVGGIVAATTSSTPNLRARNHAPSRCPEEAPEEGTTCPKKQQGEWCAWNYVLFPTPSGGGNCTEPLRCIPTRRCLCGETSVAQETGASTTAWTCPNMAPIFCDEEHQPLLSFEPCTTECPHKRPRNGEPCTFWPSDEGEENCTYDCNPTTLCNCDYSTGSGIWDCVRLRNEGYCDEKPSKFVQTEHKWKHNKESKKSKKSSGN
eukprot:scaffold10892_cov163-Amphora_coffeaeformis.AAC.11